MRYFLRNNYSPSSAVKCRHLSSNVDKQKVKGYTKAGQATEMKRRARGTGSIKKRAAGSYTIIVSQLDPGTGKYRQKWMTVRGTKADAERRLRDELQRIDRGSFPDSGKKTVAGYLREWLDDYCKNRLSQRSLERYQGIIETYFIPAFGHVKLSELRAAHLRQHYDMIMARGRGQGKDSANTVRFHHSVIHKALQTAVKKDLLNQNVADKVDLPRVMRKEMEIWTQDDINQFLGAAKDTPYYVPFCTALYTGMRRSELLGLKWTDIDLQHGRIAISRGLHQLKGGTYIFAEPKSKTSRRSIAIPTSLTLLLKEHFKSQKMEDTVFGKRKGDSDLVFCTSKGGPLRPNTVTRAWTMVIKKCGVKRIRLHDARHTYASLMLLAGTNLKVVSERLGHSGIDVTADIYSHVMPGLDEEAARKFDEIMKRRDL